MTAAARIVELEEQLAAERERGQKECDRLDAFWQNEVARQLAAEREDFKQFHKAEMDQLRKQLSEAQAAAIAEALSSEITSLLQTKTVNDAIADAQQPFVDALTKAKDRFQKSGWPEAADECEAALGTVNNPNCDGGGPCVVGGQVRVLPTGGDSNAILCQRCYHREMKFRKERNRELSPDCKFRLPRWEELRVYETG